MSPAEQAINIAALKAIDDDAAGRLLSAGAWDELEAAILATPVAPGATAHRRRPALENLRRPFLVLVAASALAAVVLGLTGVLSGGGPAAPQAADAAVLRGALAALVHPPGSIVIESYSSVQRTNPKYVTFAPGHKPPRGIQVTRWSQREITETPVGSGPQNEVNLGGPSVEGGVQIGEVDGNNELYDPHDNTVYISSNYGVDITPGPRPGTFVFTMPKTPNAPPGSAAAQENAHLPPPLTITAAQARALRDGTAMVNQVPDQGSRTASHVEIIPAFRAPDEWAEIRFELNAGKLRVAGRVTVDGRQAIKLVASRGHEEYDVAPGTYNPVRQVLSYGPAYVVTTIYSEYRVLPATPANERLLNLAFLHPGARVDRRPADYIAAQARLITGS